MIYLSSIVYNGGCVLDFHLPLIIGPESVLEIRGDGIIKFRGIEPAIVRIESIREKKDELPQV